ncbi:hypothetical protein TKK_0000359 [Trichogramma kaykai]
MHENLGLEQEKKKKEICKVIRSKSNLKSSFAGCQEQQLPFRIADALHRSFAGHLPSRLTSLTIATYDIKPGNLDGLRRRQPPPLPLLLLRIPYRFENLSTEIKLQANRFFSATAESPWFV